MDHREVGEYWERNAEAWTRLCRQGFNVSRDEITTPAFLALIPEVAGLSGLDIGCGDGYNTRLVARRGARMTAVDIAPTFIRLAREQEERDPVGVDYRVASAAELPFPDRAFDFVVAFMSFMDIPDLDGTLREAFRVLRPGGFLQFAITHPCFDRPLRAWVRDEAGHKVAYQCGDYFKDPDGRVEEWLFSTTPPEVRHATPMFQVPTFCRPLSVWLNALTDAGFIPERFDEPYASDETLRRFPKFAGTRVVALWLIVRCRRPAEPRGS
jgi:ubiquinone/menaquinone biosynthesis C-methylase UbiE